MANMLRTLVACVFDLISHWISTIWTWWHRKSPRNALLEALASAKTFEEWDEAAFALDMVLGHDLWRQNPTSKHYDYGFIYSRLTAITKAHEEDRIGSVVGLLRSGLVRNLANIITPRLYTRAYAGTKLLIEDYITQVVLAIDYLTTYPVDSLSGLTGQQKLDVLHDTRQSFGRSVLVLQGGAIFGLCHLGVIKALHLRGLLPRIIAGTATGALIAALVGVHTDTELLELLKGSSIDLTAFLKRSASGTETSPHSTWYSTLVRRLKRFVREGYFLDVKVLEDVVRSNVEDLTFHEAYTKTKRVLNITVSTANGSVPNLLNYVTTPNVLIWSAAVASNASATPMMKPVKILCKDDAGAIVEWMPNAQTTFQPWTHANYKDTRESPLHRMAELFNVNHFVVSQARPYLAPFLRSDLHHPGPGHASAYWSLFTPVLRFTVLEIQHRLRQLDAFGLLHPSIRRFLLDESVPGPSLTLVPELTASDLFKLMENPTRESLDYWILRGERSVWPAVGALKIRCAIEVELDRGYQVVRRRRKGSSGASGLGLDTGTKNDLGGIAAEWQRSGSRGDVWERDRQRAGGGFDGEQRVL